MQRTLGFLAMLTAVAAAGGVAESARLVPVEREVDVVVVGGTTGAVAAAAACARAGATVYLAAPRPYLGEDMAMPLRLWLEPGEEPTTELGKRIFAPEARRGHEPAPLSHPFTYRPDKPSDRSHADSPDHSRLRDGRFGPARTDSVQYAGPVAITADLGADAAVVAEAVAYVYHRSDYSLGRVVCEGSADGEAWEALGDVPIDLPPQEGPDSTGHPIRFPVGRSLRFFRLTFTNAPESGRVLIGELAFIKEGEAAAGDVERMAIRPLHLKQVLDEELLAAGVPFVFSSYPTEVVRDADGRLAGVVVANRAGRQAILAKVVIDASERATVARLAGAKVPDWPAGMQSFRRVVIGGQPHAGPGIAAVRTIEPPLTFRGQLYPVYEYDLNLNLAADTPGGWAEIEQQARDLTFDPGLQFASETLWAVPPVAVSGSGEGLSAFRPAGTEGLLVLGPLAGVSREAAAGLCRPDGLIAAGEKIGLLAAEMARETAKAVKPQVAAQIPATGDGLDVGEVLGGMRPVATYPQIQTEAGSLPVWAEVDVVVVGGGTSGAPAGIGAARNGADTLVLEYLYGLGGVGTLGAISKYYHGYRGGFTREVPEGASWGIETRAEWWRQEIRRPGGRIWFGVIGCGAVLEGNRVRGVVVAGPFGRGVVLAKTVIDSTGAADIAAAGGAACVYTDGSDIAVQGTGLPFRDLGASYRNTDFTITDETDMADVTSLFVYAKRKYPAASFDQGHLIDTRERRRIVGETTLNILDMVNGRTYPDTIVRSQTNFDTHGYTVDPYLALQILPAKRSVTTWTPYRALLPRDLRGILVTGLGISVHRDAVPLIRMQPDLQNQGYAAGTAAAMVRDRDGEPRNVDMAELQRHLVAKDILPETMIGAEDALPLSDQELAEAARNLAEKPEGLSLLMADPARALPALRETLAATTDPEARVALAQTLAVLGDPAGVADLVQAVRAHETWDKGWNYRAMGQFGTNKSPLDILIYALGRSGDPQGVEAILEKAALLDAETDFSHHRAAAMALESLGSSAAAPVLAAVLAKPGMSGHALLEVGQAIAAHTEVDRSLTALIPRRNALRELYLARALYRCGDADGLGRRILESYTRDLRGHFARHAAAVLSEGK